MTLAPHLCFRESPVSSACHEVQNDFEVKTMNRTSGLHAMHYHKSWRFIRAAQCWTYPSLPARMPPFLQSCLHALSTLRVCQDVQHHLEVEEANVRMINMHCRLQQALEGGEIIESLSHIPFTERPDQPRDTGLSM
jgi:hypothetical protein